MATLRNPMHSPFGRASPGRRRKTPCAAGSEAPGRGWRGRREDEVAPRGAEAARPLARRERARGCDREARPPRATRSARKRTNPEPQGRSIVCPQSQQSGRDDGRPLLDRRTAARARRRQRPREQGETDQGHEEGLADHAARSHQRAPRDGHSPPTPSSVSGTSSGAAAPPTACPSFSASAAALKCASALSGSTCTACSYASSASGSLAAGPRAPRRG